MKKLNIMIKPASSLCNLRCKYCFYADVSDSREIRSFGVMQEDTLEAILKNIFCELNFGDGVNFTFQGGEPLLAGIDFYVRFLQLVDEWDKDINVSYALQTNGILLNDEWCQLFKKYNFLIGISLDVLKECHDLTRVYANGKGTYTDINKAMRLLDEFKVEYNVLCTLTNTVARFPQKVWKTINELKIKYIQFTPCLGNLDDMDKSPFALTPKRFASFYIGFFRCWYEDYRKGKYISIKFFDDIVNLIAYGVPTCCGIDGICRPQLVVEADSSAYPCDFYSIDEYRLGYLNKQTVSQLLASENAVKFSNRDIHKPKACDNCRYKAFCGGNCARMRKEICCDDCSLYCGYKEFLDECYDEFVKITKSLLFKAQNRR